MSKVLLVRMQKIKIEKLSSYATQRELRWHTMLWIGSLFLAVLFLYGGTKQSEVFMQEGKRFTYCDGQALANAVWRTPIEDSCLKEHSDFRKYIVNIRSINN